MEEVREVLANREDTRINKMFDQERKDDTMTWEG